MRKFPALHDDPTLDALDTDPAPSSVRREEITLVPEHVMKSRSRRAPTFEVVRQWPHTLWTV
jgi:hypothetical protein